MPLKRCCPWCGCFHPADAPAWKNHQERLKEATAVGFWNPADGYPAKEKMVKPKGAIRFGRCPDCHKYGWLHEWFHLVNELCGDCINDALGEMDAASRFDGGQ
jgi:hypothetical protein